MQGQVAVRNTCRGRRFGKARLRVEIAVRVDINHERVARSIDAQVDPAVVTALERIERSQGHFDAPRFDCRVEHRRLRRAVDALGRRFVPLGDVRENVGLVVERFAEDDFSQGQGPAR